MNPEIRLVKARFNTSQNILIEKKEVMPHCTLHRHDFNEFEIIIRGSGVTKLNGNTYEVKPGMAVLLSPGDLHEYISDEQIELYNIQFTADCVDGAVLDGFWELGDRIRFLDTKSASSIMKICEVISELEAEESQQFCATRLFESLLVLFGTHFEKSHDKSESSQPITQAISYIQTHFKNSPTLSEVASSVYLNPRYFCTLFKRRTGVNYKSYLRNIKLNYAARLIMFSELPITEVAAESGYASLSHFNREFLAFFGESPSAARKSKKLNSQNEQDRIDFKNKIW